MAVFDLLGSPSLPAKETILQLKLSSKCGGAACFVLCLAVAAVPAGSDAPAAQAKPVPGRAIEQPGNVVAFEQVDLFNRL
jgi:hypothetical protein